VNEPVPEMLFREFDRIRMIAESTNTTERVVLLSLNWPQTNEGT
jgi:hypothetical protein